MPAVPILGNAVDLIARPGDPRYFHPSENLTKGFYNNSEGGTNTTTVTTGNSGGISGNNYDVINIGTGNTVTYATAAAYRGSLGIQVTTPSVTNNGNASVVWKNSLFGGGNGSYQVFTRMFFQVPTSFPLTGTSDTLVRAATTNNAQNAKVCVTTAGNWQLFGNAGAIWTSTNTLSLGTWYRLEFWSTYPGTGGTNSRAFTAMYAGDSLTPIEVHQDSYGTGSGNLSTGQITFGSANAAISGYTLYMDELWASTGNFPPVYLTYTIPADPSAGTGDTGTGADAATIGVSDTDTGSGADAAVIGVSGSDSFTGADAGETITVSSSDTGSGADAGETITVSGSDSLTGADAGETITVSSSDMGSGTESQQIAVSSSDLVSGSEGAAQLTLSSADAGSGSEGIAQIFLSSTDTASAVDAAFLMVTSADFGTGTEGQLVTVIASQVTVTITPAVQAAMTITPAVQAVTTITPAAGATVTITSPGPAPTAEFPAALPLVNHPPSLVEFPPAPSALMHAQH